MRRFSAAILLLGQRAGIPQRRQLLESAPTAHPDLSACSWPPARARHSMSVWPMRQQLVRREGSRLLADPRRPHQRGEQFEQAEAEETTEQPTAASRTELSWPNASRGLDVAVDGSVDCDVVVALLRNLDCPDPHMHVAVDCRCPADAFGDLRVRHAGGRIDAETQVRDRKSARRPAGGPSCGN